MDCIGELLNRFRLPKKPRTLHYTNKYTILPPSLSSSPLFLYYHAHFNCSKPFSSAQHKNLILACESLDNRLISNLCTCVIWNFFILEDKMIRATRSATGYNEKQWRRGVAAWHHSPLSGICTHFPFYLSLSFSFSLSFCLSIFLSMWHMCVQPYDEHPLVSWKIVVGRGRYPLSLLLLFRRANQPPSFACFESETVILD